MPPSIFCSTLSKASCTFEGNPEVWGINSDKVGRGTYFLTEVISPYNGSNFLETKCKYDYGPTDIPSLTLESSPFANIEAYSLGDNTGWVFVENYALCEVSNSTTKSCPMKKKAAIVINNTDIKDGIYISSNNRQIKEIIHNSENISFSFDDILPNCVENRECTLGIYSSNGGIYGTVKVDMDDKLKIVAINANHPSEVTIKRIAGFNAIEVRKYRDPMPANAKFCVYQLTDFNSIFRLSDNTWIPVEEDNISYQKYKAWVSLGNKPALPNEYCLPYCVYQKKSNKEDGIYRVADRQWIPKDGSNRNWVLYEEWLAEGNLPAAAEFNCYPE